MENRRLRHHHGTPSQQARWWRPHQYGHPAARPLPEEGSCRVSVPEASFQPILAASLPAALAEPRAADTQEPSRCACCCSEQSSLSPAPSTPPSLILRRARCLPPAPGVLSFSRSGRGQCKVLLVTTHTGRPLFQVHLFPAAPGARLTKGCSTVLPGQPESRGRPGHRTPVGMNCKGCTPPSLHRTRSPPRWGMTSSAEIQRTHPIRSLTFPPASHPNPQGLFHCPRQHPHLATRCCLPHPTWEKLTGHVQD